jgi:hypothetical protein
MSGRDRRHYVAELRKAEEAHRSLVVQVDAAYRAAHRLACEEWNTRQFIGGDVEPSPAIADAIAGGCELLEVRCKRCGRERLVDLTEAIWPREKPVHTLAKVLRCRSCRDARKRPAPDLVALRPRNPPEPEAPARRARG